MNGMKKMIWTANLPKLYIQHYTPCKIRKILNTYITHFSVDALCWRRRLVRSHLCRLIKHKWLSVYIIFVARKHDLYMCLHLYTHTNLQPPVYYIYLYTQRYYYFMVHGLPTHGRKHALLYMTYAFQSCYSCHRMSYKTRCI